MAFCGQCGLLLNTNITTCPRCGTQTDFDAAIPGTPANDNAATVIAYTDNSQSGRASHTPHPHSREIPSPDAKKAGYYPAPEENAYPGQQPSPPDYQPGNSSYPSPGFPPSGSNYPAPGAPYSNSMPLGNRQAPAQGMYQPSVFPTTDSGYQYQPPIPPRKTNKGLILVIIVLIVALVAVTGLLFAMGSKQFATLFGTKNTPTVTPPTSTSQTTSTTRQTQQAQATIQQYYIDINNQDFQDAYDLWVINPETYDNFKQGFAHTHHDAITLEQALPQIDGTVQVYLTVQATEDTTGGGTQVSTYQGYYTVGQQTDGSWKIINGQLG